MTEIETMTVIYGNLRNIVSQKGVKTDIYMAPSETPRIFAIQAHVVENDCCKSGSRERSEREVDSVYSILTLVE